MASLVEMRSIERENAKKRHELANRILETLNSPDKIAGLLHHIPPLLRSGTGIEAVGIRLPAGQNFPYIESEGFPEHFLEPGKLLRVGIAVTAPSGPRVTAATSACAALS